MTYVEPIWILGIYQFKVFPSQKNFKLMTVVVAEWHSVRTGRLESQDGLGFFGSELLLIYYHWA